MARPILSDRQLELLREIVGTYPNDVGDVVGEVARGEEVEEWELERITQLLNGAILAADEGYPGEPLSARSVEITDLIVALTGPSAEQADEPKYNYEGLSSAALKNAAMLVWPSWVEKRGCVLRENRAADDAIAAWLDGPEGSVERTESMLNHLHLDDLVEGGWDEPEDVLDERLMEVAQRMAAAWEASLQRAFPDRTFNIEIVGVEDDPFGPTVYCWSEPPQSA